LPHRLPFFRRSFTTTPPVGRVLHLAPTRRTTLALYVAGENLAAISAFEAVRPSATLANVRFIGHF
jgi:hypothetical protein